MARTGPRFAIANLAASAAVFLICLGVYGHDPEGMLVAIRITTRIAFLLFITVVICRPLRELAHTPLTSWMMRNRRYLALSYASWHLMHWPILTAMVVILEPAGFMHKVGSFIIPSGAVLLVITLLAATSSDRAVRFFGRRLWSAIHTISLYTIWVYFLRIYLERLPNPEHFYVYVYIGLLFGALGFRWAMAIRRLMHRHRFEPERVTK